MLLVMIVCFITITTGQKFNSKVTTVLRICPKNCSTRNIQQQQQNPKLIKFINKPTSEVCSEIIEKLTPSEIVFYANLILIAIISLTCILVIAIAFIFNQIIGDEFNKFGKIKHYVTGYTATYRDIMDEVD